MSVHTNVPDMHTSILAWTHKQINCDMCTLTVSSPPIHCSSQREVVTGILKAFGFTCSHWPAAILLGVHCAHPWEYNCEVPGVCRFYKRVNLWVPSREFGPVPGQKTEDHSPCGWCWPLPRQTTGQERRWNIKHICTTKCSPARDSMCTPTFNITPS